MGFPDFTPELFLGLDIRNYCRSAQRWQRQGVERCFNTLKDSECIGVGCHFSSLASNSSQMDDSRGSCSLSIHVFRFLVSGLELSRRSPILEVILFLDTCVWCGQKLVSLEAVKLGIVSVYDGELPRYQNYSVPLQSRCWIPRPSSSSHAHLRLRPILSIWSQKITSLITTAYFLGFLWVVRRLAFS